MHGGPSGPHRLHTVYTPSTPSAPTAICCTFTSPHNDYFDAAHTNGDAQHELEGQLTQSNTATTQEAARAIAPLLVTAHASPKSLQSLPGTIFAFWPTRWLQLSILPQHATARVQFAQAATSLLPVTIPFKSLKKCARPSACMLVRIASLPGALARNDAHRYTSPSMHACRTPSDTAHCAHCFQHRQPACDYQPATTRCGTSAFLARAHAG